MADYAAILLNSASPVPIPHTPSNLLHFNRPSPADRFDDSGPYKAEMLARMDQLQRGDRVLPPCDRCRRLHMDCLKNLTACQGCTKKHAKCSWKDVTDQELRDNPYVPRSEKEELSGAADSPEIMSVLAAAAEDGPVRSVRDEELLGEDASDDYVPSSPKEPHGPDPVDHIMGEAKSYEVRTSEESREISQPVEPEDRMATSVEQPKNPATVNEPPEAQPPITKPENDHDRVRASGSFEAINHSSTENKAQIYPIDKYEEQDQEKISQRGHPNSRGSEQEHHVGQKIWNMISNHSTPRDEQAPNDVQQKHVWASIPNQIGTDRS